MTNSESQRYPYPVCHTQWPPSIPYPDSKVQREALDCPPRGPSWPPRWFSGSLVENKKKGFILWLDKPDQTPPFSSLRSKRSEAFWLRASPTSSSGSPSLSVDLQACSHNNA